MSRTHVEVLLLGPFEARVAGTPVALGGPRPRALLALLALEPNGPVALDRLVDALWSDDERPATARHAVRVYASRLRGTLEGAVVSRAGGYALEAGDTAVDARRFERLVADGQRLRAAGDAGGAAERLGEALGLWRGEALADFAYAEWAQAEISRLEDLRLTALEERFDAELELGRHAALVHDLERLVDEHPLRERLRGQLMLALYRAGRQADALGAYRDARAALLGELGLEPSGELRALEAAILRQDTALAVEPEELRRRRRLPSSPTKLVGRRREVDDIASLLRGDARLVTVTGPGGIGKTRVSLQAAHELAADFADGVSFVGLAPVRDPALVVDAVAGALGAAEQPGRERLDVLREHLRHHKALLVLDNFEHVETASPVISELLAAGDDVAVIATSRSRLRLYGEHVYELEPLVLEDEAVPLFVARAGAVARGFAADARVAAVCRRLDCLPLAIELAAARVPDVSLDAMVASLSRLDLAAEGPRDLSTRQQTLRAAIAWSHDLLDEPLRIAFARLGTFVGGCTAEAAEAVAGASGAELGALVERALVRREGERFTLLETIREYALERLGVGDEREDVRARHAAHFLALAEEAQRALNEGRDHVSWLDRLEEEHANLRAALSWALGRGDAALALRLVVGLGSFWEWRGHVREAGGWFAAALALEGPPDETRARALLRASAFAHLQGDFAGATALADELLEAAEALGDARLRASGLRKLATIAKDTGEHERAATLHERGLAASRSAGDRPGISSSLINLADLALSRDAYEPARRLAEESVVLARELADPMRELVSLLNLGFAQLGAGVPGAVDSFARVVDLAAEARYADGLACALEGLGALEAQRGEHRRALLLVGAGETLLDRAGSVLEAAELRVHERTLAAARAGLPQEEVGAARAAGRALSFDEAVTEGRDTAARLGRPTTA